MLVGLYVPDNQTCISCINAAAVCISNPLETVIRDTVLRYRVILHQISHGTMNKEPIILIPVTVCLDKAQVACTIINCIPPQNNFAQKNCIYIRRRTDS